MRSHVLFSNYRLAAGSASSLQPLVIFQTRWAPAIRLALQKGPEGVRLAGAEPLLLQGISLVPVQHQEEVALVLVEGGNLVIGQADLVPPLRMVQPSSSNAARCRLFSLQHQTDHDPGADVV